MSAELERNEVWNEPERAQNLGRERARLEDVVHTLDRVDAGLRDAAELLEMAEAEGDTKTLAEIERDVGGLSKIAEDMEFKRMFSGEMDAQARTGRRCSCACTPNGPTPRASRSS